MQQLSGQDSMFLYLESAKSPMHIGGLYIFEPPNDETTFKFDEIKEYIRQRLHMSKVFRQKLAPVPLDLGKPFWVQDEDFDLDYHLMHMALPEPGNRKALAELSAQIYNPPLDRARPLWKMTFITGLGKIEGVENPNAFAMVAQVHHSMIDGGSGVEIMSAILNLSADAPPPKPPKTKWKPERVPTGAELLAKSYGNAFSNPLKFFNFVKDTVPKIFDEMTKEVTKNLDKAPSGSPTAPKSIFNVPVTGHKIFGAVDVPLADLKAIKDQVPEAKLNDVILSVCGGALRRYLMDRDELPKKSLIAMAPVSVRSKNESGKMGNRVSAMLPKLGTHIEDPVERLQSICKKTKKSKTRSKALGADKIMEFVPSEVAALAGRLYTKMGLSELHKPFFNMVITNVPGPPMPLYMNGFKLVNLYGFGACFDGIGMMIVIFSHAGNVSICVTSIKEIIPDIEVFTDYIKDEIDVLQKALV